MPRPKSFDPDEKLEEAMTLFWSEGFESTSIPLLETRLGINRFSIYDTFGNKRTLFVEALRRYEQGLVRDLVHPLEVGSAGLTDLRRCLRTFRERFVDSGAPGCLLCNTATELGTRDPAIARQVNDYYRRLESAILEGLKRAEALGEIQAGARELRARALVGRSSLQGILVELRSSADAARARRTLTALESICLAP